MKAIVFIDVQNDFVKGGKLAFGYPAEDNLQKVVNFANECVADPKCKIYATRDTHEATKWTEVNCAQVVTGYLATLEGQKLRGRPHGHRNDASRRRLPDSLRALCRQ